MVVLTLLMLFRHTFLTFNRSPMLRDTFVGVPGAVSRVDGFLMIKNRSWAHTSRRRSVILVVFFAYEPLSWIDCNLVCFEVGIGALIPADFLN